MKLTRVTITGADDNVDPQALYQLSREFDFGERPMMGSGLLKPERLRYELAAHIDAEAAAGLSPRDNAKALAEAILDLVEGRDEQQTNDLLDSVRLLTRLHLGTGDSACPACGECEGNHHFSESGLQVPESGEPFFECKHCEAKAHICEECEGPIYPITGATICAECTANPRDFE